MSQGGCRLAFGNKEEQIFLGREIATRKDYSEKTAQDIDAEVKRIISDCYEKARSILTEHEQQLHDIAEALLERETLDAEDVKILLNGGNLPPIKKKPERKKTGDKTEPASPVEADLHAETDTTDETPSSGEPSTVDETEDTVRNESGPADLFTDMNKDNDPDLDT